MPKKIKTRKQKLQRDLRKQTSEVSYALPVAASPTKAEKRVTVPPPPAATAQVTGYHYLKVDLLKTMLFSIAIVTIELVLRFFVVKS